MEKAKRVSVTEEAKQVIDKLRAQHGPLMFHQSGGCCDGSQPMCFEEGEFKVGDSDVLLGKVQGCNFYIAKDQYEYWKHTHLTLDVTPGRGASFSLEIPLGLRFHIRSRLFTEAEMAQLPKL
ncbi:DUF779 domain-containing protein [Pontibacter oryzae]|uniref:DUF779 domain-containing protein n=1 Tax=Pontibacter oryzae TaxID=2304593 RepID=A0A399SJL2_9BACT|nr:DUF779 domain-containing protein [Pontibacter oryzae]RIJ42087.1 DUF779 domain-containing protein [Pontibacter oryzae]